jgi:stearoyl-CoA desaturase (delta-9 desaturase)
VTRTPALELGGNTLPFVLMHVACLAVLVVGVTPDAVAVGLAGYVLRAIGITAGYHRYFSHRSFRTSRAFQLVLAVLGTLALQKGVLWWVAHHRHHHRHADADGDPHSPVRGGLWWSHVGWFLAAGSEQTDRRLVRDLARVPELVWLDRHFLLPSVACATVLAVAGGARWVVWGSVVATTLTWHLTYAVNSLGHRYGRRRYDTADDSRNSFWLALVTWGEGWHNNHHRYMRAARQGFFWWEVDLTWMVLRALARAGIVWDLVEPPQSALAVPAARAA